MPSNFWMTINNERNFRITQRMGFTVMGLKAQHRRKIQRVADGDRILMYLSHRRRFVATATAISDYFEAGDTIWEKEGKAGFPYRVNIRPEIVLRDDQFMDANLIAPSPGIHQTLGPRGLVHGLSRQPAPAAQERFPADRGGNEKATLRPPIRTRPHNPHPRPPPPPPRRPPQTRPQHPINPPLPQSHKSPSPPPRGEG